MTPVDALKRCTLFQGFTDTGLQIIAGISSARSFPTGAPLFVENMIADSLLVIADGHVRLSSKGPQGEDVVLGEMSPGDSLGELSLITQGQRMCTATALSNVTAVEIRHADFQKLLGQKPQACVKLLMGIVRQFGLRVADNRESFKSLLAKAGAQRG
jgi:CRP/FNR family cyclic AMP-dependent transcriptional regulator